MGGGWLSAGPPWPAASACALTAVRASSGSLHATVDSRRESSGQTGRVACSLRDDVLHGKAGVGLDALDDMLPLPAGALAGEGRDDDLVDPLVVGGVHRRRVRVGVNDL